ncbi:sulfatase-like hydrolase/transferase, partial [Alistipes putredinis]|uniref:sulfatase-like hydrolase/transferase n=1 Tax=Alistipes putredinis TaxID=28117 RepID=UPI0023B08509
ENIADSITTHAIDFIKQHKDEPIFIYFATNDVHVPRFPHDRFRGKNPMGLRGDAIAQFDWTVGQLMETLDQLGLTENTLIILSSDNGPVVDDGYKDKA